MTPFDGIEVRESLMLTGQKHALQFGDGPIYVSPAMWELMKLADEKELALLLRSIHVRHLPALPDLRSLGDFRLTEPPSFVDDMGAINRRGFR